MCSVTTRTGRSGAQREQAMRKSTAAPMLRSRSRLSPWAVSLSLESMPHLARRRGSRRANGSLATGKVGSAGRTAVGSQIWTKRAVRMSASCARTCAPSSARAAGAADARPRARSVENQPTGCCAPGPRPWRIRGRPAARLAGACAKGACLRAKARPAQPAHRHRKKGRCRGPSRGRGTRRARKGTLPTGAGAAGRAGAAAA